jgi:hypothetical protein
MKSSLTLQLLLYLGSHYSACFGAAELLLLLYKSAVLPYPAGNLVAEVLLLLLLGVIETCRVLSGWKGNLTESPGKHIPHLKHVGDW